MPSDSRYKTSLATMLNLLMTVFSAICEREVMNRVTNHQSYQEKKKGQSFELAFPVGTPEDVERIYNEIVAKGATSIKPPESERERAIMFASIN